MDNVFVVTVDNRPISAHSTRAGAHFAAEQKIVELSIEFDDYEEELQTLLDEAKKGKGLCNRESRDLQVWWNDSVSGDFHEEMCVGIEEIPLST